MTKTKTAKLSPIKFGTDGWRARIGEDFNFENVQRVAAAVADYVREEGDPERGLLVGYDMRFLSPEAAEVAAEAVAARGVPVTLSDRPTPTPAIRCNTMSCPRVMTSFQRRTIPTAGRS